MDRPIFYSIILLEGYGLRLGSQKGELAGRWQTLALHRDTANKAGRFADLT
jgi:hypothetical protein